MNAATWIVVALACALIGTVALAQVPAGRLAADERRMLLDELRSALKMQAGWPRIHAAEALIGQGLADETLPVFRPLTDSAPAEERIGVWRVLAQAEPTDGARKKMVERVRAAFRDVNGPDRLHAVETLAKLRVQMTDNDRRVVEEFARRSAAEATFANWLLTQSGDASARSALVDALGNCDPVARQRAAYALSHLEDPLTRIERAALTKAALADPADSAGRIALIGAAARSGEDREPSRKLLVEATRSADAEQRRQAATWLGEAGHPADSAVLAALATDEDPRVRMAAANARLRIDQRVRAKP